MRAGDVLLFRGSVQNPTDLAIMLASGSRWVHVGVAVGATGYVEALRPRVVYTDAATLAGRDHRLVSPPYAGEAERAAATAAAAALVGRRYDTLGLLALAIYLRAPGGRRLALAALTRLPWHRGRVICSEVAALALAAGRLQLPTPPPATHPGDVARAHGVDEQA